jgi:hypothetical protein
MIGVLRKLLERRAAAKARKRLIRDEQVQEYLDTFAQAMANAHERLPATEEGSRSSTTRH